MNQLKWSGCYSVVAEQPTLALSNFLLRSLQTGIMVDLATLIAKVKVLRAAELLPASTLSSLPRFRHCFGPRNVDCLFVVKSCFLECFPYLSLNLTRNSTTSLWASESSQAWSIAVKIGSSGVAHESVRFEMVVVVLTFEWCLALN